MGGGLIGALRLSGSLSSSDPKVHENTGSCRPCNHANREPHTHFDILVTVLIFVVQTELQKKSQTKGWTRSLVHSLEN